MLLASRLRNNLATCTCVNYMCQSRKGLVVRVLKLSAESLKTKLLLLLLLHVRPFTEPQHNDVLSSRTLPQRHSWSTTISIITYTQSRGIQTRDGKHLHIHLLWLHRWNIYSKAREDLTMSKNWLRMIFLQIILHVWLRYCEWSSILCIPMQGKKFQQNWTNSFRKYIYYNTVVFKYGTWCTYWSILHWVSCGRRSTPSLQMSIPHQLGAQSTVEQAEQRSRQQLHPVKGCMHSQYWVQYI